jgi:hypothetical protein
MDSALNLPENEANVPQMETAHVPQVLSTFDEGICLGLHYMRPKPWQRATRAPTCQVCHMPGCLCAGPHDMPLAVVCARVESIEPIGTASYLHLLRDNGPTWAIWRCALPRNALLGGPRL